MEGPQHAINGTTAFLNYQTIKGLVKYGTVHFNDQSTLYATRHQAGILL
jgi:hypothetical protein